MSAEVFAPSDLPSGSEGKPQTYDVEGPSVVEFLPWHHPRKQFVRSEQWAVAIEAHLAMSPIEGRPLCYIGLPGDDLLDIRYFAERICSGRMLPLEYLGFNQNIDASSSRRTRVDSAMFDIRTQYAVVCESSEVVSDSFASLAEPRSIASKKIESFGFFDIINLDLCDGLAKNPPGATETGNYEAIQHLLGRQFKSRNSWLLFLTTRVGEDHCEQATKQLLERLVQTNESNCDGFAAAIAEMCGTSLSKATTGQRMLVINLCGLLKWLGNMCISESGWQMQTLTVDAYTVYGGAEIEDLFSVALRFVPITSPAYDPLGLGTALPQSDDECRIAMEVIGKVRDRRNVDQLLANNAEIYQRTVAEKSELLKGAGYDPVAYAKHVVQSWKLPSPTLSKA